MIDLERFIGQHITKRTESLCRSDLEQHEGALTDRIRGTRILVIGGGGTIGTAFIKAILAYRPAAVIVVDISENGLAELVRDLRSTYRIHIPDTLITYPFSYSGTDFNHLLETHGPFDIVAHFAAHKHVRSEKDASSIAAMLRNNVLNTYKLLERLSVEPPDHFFSVSTDKATDPINVMGASKKLMEDLIMSYSDQFRVTTARFANVAFSNGSLLDAFLHRLRKRQPLAAPTDVERYFVSAREAGHICLLACMLGSSGEIFFPKLDREDTERFNQIAVKLLRELGYEIEACSTEEEARKKAAALSMDSLRYPVYFFETDTSGEKEIEYFHRQDEEPDFNRFNSLGVLQAQRIISPVSMDQVMRELTELLDDIPTDKSVFIDQLEDWLPNFNHLDTGKQLDERM